MAGTITGGEQAAITNKLKYGIDFYQKIGKIGGTKSRTGGFYKRPDLARKAGTLGGSLSSRGGYKLTPKEKLEIRQKVAKRYPSTKAWIREETQADVERKQRILSKYAVKRPW